MVRGNKNQGKQDLSESMQCLYEATIWMAARIREMKLKDKDVVIVIGPTRAGKGTLLAALNGVKM